MTSAGEAVYLACERIDQKLTKTQRILFFFFGFCFHRIQQLTAHSDFMPFWLQLDC